MIAFHRRGFNSHSGHCRVKKTLGNFSHPIASVTKQYKLVPAKAGSYTGTPCDALARVHGLQSFGWCLAEATEAEITLPYGSLWLRKDLA